MAVKDGLPATDFSRMNREYIKKVAEEAGGGSGGGEEKLVITYEYGEGDAVVADKTYAEILAAYTDGKEISAVLFESPGYDYLYLAEVYGDESNGAFKFRDLPRMATDDHDTPTELTINQEEINHGVTDSVESITENYVNVTIPLS